MQKNLEPSKKVTQNLVHKSLENITHFLNIRRLQPKQGPHQVSINKIWFNGDPDTFLPKYYIWSLWNGRWLISL